MTPRLNIYENVPGLQQTLQKLSGIALKGLDERLVHLVELRASQINKCAFCIDMHSKDARAAGESEERIALVAAFEEAPEFFDERERAALALTESVTVLTDGFVPDDVYERAAKHFDEAELGHLITAITVINAWNRLNVTARTPGGHYQPGAFG